jgi:TetR/AcrR family tetracycline transcriptional repressor
MRGMSPSRRPPSLTREDIVAAALRIIEQHGLPRLTMRAVSTELGVTPMATYYYVDDKEHLVRLVSEEVRLSFVPLRLGEDGWEASLARHLTSIWEAYARYPGLGAYMIELPTLGVTEGGLRDGIRFFEDAGFPAAQARLAWAFALTYIHGRLSVDARSGHNPEAPRLDGLRSRDYVDFGIDAVVAGLRTLRESDAGSSARTPRARSSRRR